MDKEIVILSSGLEKNFGEIISVDNTYEEVFVAKDLPNLLRFLIDFTFLLVISAVKFLCRQFEKETR